jgi:putative iron-regulated protein
MIKEQPVIRFALLFGLVFLAACSPEKESILKHSNEVTIDSSAFSAQVGLVAYTSLSKANQSAQTLDSKLASFMYHPNPMSHEEIQQAWRNAYNDFLASLIFSYLPIQDPPDWHTQRIGYRHLLTQLDSWPIEGGYIDYIQGYPYSGIVNDLTLSIDEENLRSQHGFTDSSNASLGFHALEFMFWGGQSQRTPHDFFPQENTAPVPINDSEQEGLEPLVDSNNDQGIADIKPQNHNRRRQYTQLLSELLLKDLHRVQRRWEPSSGYYAQLLQQSSTENTLQAAFIAAQELIRKELLNKRFQLISSEFSQSSQADLLAVLIGLENWFMPTDTEQEEASLLFLMQQANKESAEAFATSLQQTKTCINKMTTNPKDIDQCKQDTIQLLSSLRHTASSLRVQLPDLD